MDALMSRKIEGFATLFLSQTSPIFEVFLLFLSHNYDPRGKFKEFSSFFLQFGRQGGKSAKNISRNKEKPYKTMFFTKENDQILAKSCKIKAGFAKENIESLQKAAKLRLDLLMKMTKT